MSSSYMADERNWLASGKGRGLLGILSHTAQRLTFVQLGYELSPILKEFYDNNVIVPHSQAGFSDLGYTFRLQSLLDGLHNAKNWWLPAYDTLGCPEEERKDIGNRILDLGQKLQEYEPLLRVAGFVYVARNHPEITGEVEYCSERDIPEYAQQAITKKKAEEKREEVRFFRGMFDEKNPLVKILKGDESLREFKTFVCSMKPELQGDIVDISQLQEHPEMYRLLIVKGKEGTTDLCVCYTKSNQMTHLGLYVVQHNERSESTAYSIGNNIFQDLIMVNEEMYREELERIQQIRQRDNF